MPHTPEDLVADMSATDGTNVAQLFGDRWGSVNPSFALWLNTAFARAGRDDAALAVDLEAHGLACEYDAAAEPVI
jgi:hypothetical protein